MNFLFAILHLPSMAENKLPGTMETVSFVHGLAWNSVLKRDDDCLFVLSWRWWRAVIGLQFIGDGWNLSFGLLCVLWVFYQNRELAYYACEHRREKDIKHILLKRCCCSVECSLTLRFHQKLSLQKMHPVWVEASEFVNRVFLTDEISPSCVSRYDSIH